MAAPTCHFARWRAGRGLFFSNITGRKQAEAAQRRVEVLAASNRKLEQEIVRRKTLEEALKQTEQQLRHLSHELLHAQEEERKHISRELHDTVLQTLVGINIHLAALTPKPLDNPGSLQQKVAQTQLLVEKSMVLVHRFALELRPMVLDDLGVIHALHSYLKDFITRTGVRVRLTAKGATRGNIDYPAAAPLCAVRLGARCHRLRGKQRQVCRSEQIGGDRTNPGRLPCRVSGR